MGNALNYLISASWQGKAAVKAAASDIGGLGDAGKRANQGLADVKAGLDMTMDAFAMTGRVVGEFYGALKEGATLEAEAEKYDNLAASIGTTGDALMDELIPATKGMVANADLVRGASDLISLGLADTQGEVVRWSSAVSALNLDLQVLGLTLANDSTARLDGLGLGMDTVNQKTDKFIALGHEAGEAFDLAVLEALEERMALLGDASQTTAGQLQQLEVSWKNVTDAGKSFLAQRWEPIIGGLSNTINQWKEAQNDVDEAVRRGIITEQEAQGLVQDAAFGWQMKQELLAATREEVTALVAEEERQAQVMADGVVWMDNYRASAEEYSYVQQLLSNDTSYYTTMIGNVITAQEEYVVSQAAQQAAMETARGVFADSMTVVSSLSGVIQLAYGAEAVSAEEAATRIATANLAVSESYKQTAVDILQARLAQTIEEDGLGAATAMIAFQESLGLITPAEAAALQEVATKTQLITDTTNTMLDTYLADGVLAQTEIDNLAQAVDLVGTSSVLTKEQIIALSDEGLEKFTTLTGGADLTTESLFKATNQAGKLKDAIIDGLPDKKVITIEIVTVGSLPNVGGADGGPSGIPGKASGGPVTGGMPYVVGERGPELFVPRQSGTIVPNGEMGATNNWYITGSNAQDIAQEVGVILARQARLNKAAMV
jgi:peptidoglycan hydrolase-like protein with peptidoglycan-binding domain